MHIKSVIPKMDPPTQKADISGVTKTTAAAAHSFTSISPSSLRHVIPPSFLMPS